MAAMWCATPRSTLALRLRGPGAAGAVVLRGAGRDRLGWPCRPPGDPHGARRAASRQGRAWPRGPRVLRHSPSGSPRRGRVRLLAEEARFLRQSEDYQAVLAGEMTPQRFLDRYLVSRFHRAVESSPRTQSRVLTAVFAPAAWYVSPTTKRFAGKCPQLADEDLERPTPDRTGTSRPQRAPGEPGDERGRLRRHLTILDRDVDAVMRAHPGSVECRPGCSECCHQTFRVSELEGEMLPEAWPPRRPEERAAIVERARAYTAEAREPCPVLNSEGCCSLYEHRPRICRKYGVPLYPDRPHELRTCRSTLRTVCPDLDVGALGRGSGGVGERLDPPARGAGAGAAGESDDR